MRHDILVLSVRDRLDGADEGRLQSCCTLGQDLARHVARLARAISRHSPVAPFESSLFLKSEVLQASDASKLAILEPF